MANENSKIHSSSVFFYCIQHGFNFSNRGGFICMRGIFFFFYKGIPVSFSSNIILFLGKIGIYIGSFTGLMLWIANLLKK